MKKFIALIMVFCFAVVALPSCGGSQEITVKVTMGIDEGRDGNGKLDEILNEIENFEFTVTGKDPTLNTLLAQLEQAGKFEVTADANGKFLGIDGMTEYEDESAGETPKMYYWTVFINGTEKGSTSNLDLWDNPINDGDEIILAYCIWFRSDNA